MDINCTDGAKALSSKISFGGALQAVSQFQRETGALTFFWPLRGRKMRFGKFWGNTLDHFLDPPESALHFASEKCGNLLRRLFSGIPVFKKFMFVENRNISANEAQSQNLEASEMAISKSKMFVTYRKLRVLSHLCLRRMMRPLQVEEGRLGTQRSRFSRGQWNKAYLWKWCESALLEDIALKGPSGSFATFNANRCI